MTGKCFQHRNPAGEPQQSYFRVLEVEDGIETTLWIEFDPSGAYIGTSQDFKSSLPCYREITREEFDRAWNEILAKVQQLNT